MTQWSMWSTCYDEKTGGRNPAFILIAMIWPGGLQRRWTKKSVQPITLVQTGVLRPETGVKRSALFGLEYTPLPGWPLGHIFGFVDVVKRRHLFHGLNHCCQVPARSLGQSYQQS
jgi:hypothetical protein